jgi:hypothetical protein
MALGAFLAGMMDAAVGGGGLLQIPSLFSLMFGPFGAGGEHSVKGVGALTGLSAFELLQQALITRDQCEESLNGARDAITVQPIPSGQEVLIVIGEGLDKAAIETAVRGC